jgi:hypothetical protein
VDRLSLQLVSLREVMDDILGLAHELADSTIGAILAKSDLEVGLEAFFGAQIPHPHGPRASTRSGAASPGGEAGLALPPGVSLAAIPEPGVLGWVIRHSHPGEVGRIVLSDVAGGDSKMQAEVVGPDGDPAFGLRRCVVEDVVGCLNRILDGVEASVKLGVPGRPVRGPSTGHAWSHVRGPASGTRAASRKACP